MENEGEGGEEGRGEGKVVEEGGRRMWWREKEVYLGSGAEEEGVEGERNEGLGHIAEELLQQSSCFVDMPREILH